MLRRLRTHLTYANVTATLALFVALGGSSYAALKITGRDVKNGSLTYRDIKRNSLGGSRIKESRLKKVKRARRADLLGGHAPGFYLVRCPVGTRPVADACVETKARPPAPYGLARVACADVGTPRGPGRRLPSYAELIPLLVDNDVALAGGGELTSEVYPSGGRVRALVVTSELGATTTVPDTYEGRKAFRCATDPLN